MKKIWVLKYIAGNPSMFTKVTTDSGSPMMRQAALDGCAKVGGHNWRAWVEHVSTGERIAESDTEKAWKAKK